MEKRISAVKRVWPVAGAILLLIAVAGYGDFTIGVPELLDAPINAGPKFGCLEGDYYPCVSGDGLTLYFSGYTTFSESSTVYLKANYRKFDYRAPDTIIDETNTSLIRNDDEITASIGYNRDITGGFFDEWTLNTEIAYTENESNIDAYDYDRLLLTLNVSRYFQ